jgi:hypothetical protein
MIGHQKSGAEIKAAVNYADFLLLTTDYYTYLDEEAA